MRAAETRAGLAYAAFHRELSRPANWQSASGRVREAWVYCVQANTAEDMRGRFAARYLENYRSEDDFAFDEDPNRAAWEAAFRAASLH